jgi:CYTH domain-containing protein
MEVERKFLVTGPPPGLSSHPSAHIRQGYVAVAAGGDELRVRARDDKRLVTIKHGSGLVRGEVESEISAALFDALWALTAHRRVEKRRHLVPLGTLVAEVDVFAGDLEGLVMVEVEFASAEDALAFAPPPWFGPDVTDDPRYRNQALALDGAP